MTRRSLLPIVLLASLTGPLAAQASAAPRLAIEPSSPSFQDGLSTSLRLAPKARAALEDGGVTPGQQPASVGIDLQVGPAVNDLLLEAQFARGRNAKGPAPFSTDALLRLIPRASAASTSLKDLRANVMRIAAAYMAAPTLEDTKSPNRSRLICAMGTKESCAQRWPWCAIFATTMWRMAGVRAISMTPAVSGIVQWGIARGRWHEATKRISATRTQRYKPGAGDIVAYGCNRSRTYCDHTGIVASVGTTTLTTIEGNTSSPVKGRDGVATKVRSLDSWISGYITLS
ncbi:MAG: CHAP domain-containing protein [Actinomycetes bacterium]